MSRWDIAVAGAGPAGTVTAASLARSGFDVIVLERDVFPRFHVGESLLPLGITVLHALGIDLDHESFALRKTGARILEETRGEQYRISFDRTLPGTFPHAYQVDRARFDAHLAEMARGHGAEISFGSRVRRIHEREEEVVIETDSEPVSCRYFIDATGQDALGAKSRGGRRWVRGLGRYATFTQYEGVRGGLAADLFETGDILVMLLAAERWGWVIPLPDRRVSVGVVHRDGAPVLPAETCMEALIEGSPLLTGLLAGARRREPVRRCSDFSFYARTPTTARTTTVGDAACFLDPVFSSGISLGIYAGKKLADAMTPSVRLDHPLALAAHHAEMQHGYAVWERLLERFYRPNWVENTFFSPDKPDSYVRQLNTILAGDVWREDNPWQNKLLASRRRTIRFEEAPV